MDITKRDKSFRDRLIETSYEYLFSRMNHSQVKDDEKLQIAIAIAKAGIGREQKIQHSGEVGVVVSFADFLAEVENAAENRIADVIPQS